MKDKLEKLIFHGKEDPREKLFKLILIIASATSVVSIFAGFALDNPLLNALPVCVLLVVVVISMIATFRFHKVELAAMLMSVTVTCGIFPFVFFSSGGIQGGATVWFVLGILYIFIMFRGKKMIFFLTLAVAADVATYVFAYSHDWLIVSLGSKSAVYYDSLFAVIAVGITVGCMMRFQIRTNEKERERTVEQKNEIEKMSKSKDAFFANMSHEIRTPINAIIGLNEMILREAISDEVAEDALKVKNASRILLNLINDILDFSQIESDHMSIVPVKYQTSELFEDVVGLMQVRMSEKDLDFRVMIDSSLPAELIGDEMRIRQILINLLTNAAKYTPKGSVTLNVEGEMQADNKVRLTISVADTGIGIRKEDLDSLYDYFKRIDRENNRKIEGSGLGLAITKQLVSLMGGTITVDSIYRKGSVFTVTLEQPVADARPIGDVNLLWKLHVREREHYKQSFEAPMAKILVVDDNETNLLVITKLLRATKVCVETARSGEECLEMMKKKIYHVILMDSMMDGLNGEETLKEIRRRESAGRQTPVIVVTANASAGDRQKYLESGFDGYLSKPVDGDLLEAEVLKFLPEDLVEYRVGAEEARTAADRAALRRRKKKIQITTDCVSDLSGHYLDAYDLKMIYAHIETDRGVFRDTIDMDSDNLSRYLSRPGSRALAVPASVEEYENFYAEALTEAEDVIHISMASGAGMSYNAAVQAAVGFDHVHVIDSGHISCGEGLMAMAASRLLRDGCSSVEDLCAQLEILKKQIETTFMMPNAQSYYRSGHGGRLSLFMTDIFNFHPVVRMRHNDVKIRGLLLGSLESSQKRMIRSLLHKRNRIDTRAVFITHAGCSVKQQEEFVAEVLKYVPFEKVIVGRASVSCSTNGGLGTMGIAYLTKINGREFHIEGDIV